MLTRTKFLAICAAAFLVSAAASAATLDEILSAVAEQSAATKDMTCDVKMDMDLMKQSVTSSGDARFKAPGKIAMSLSMRMWVDQREVVTKMKFVSDGSLMFQEIDVPGRARDVLRLDLAAAGLSSSEASSMVKTPESILHGLKSLADVKVLDDATLADGEKAWVIWGKSVAKAGDSAEKLKAAMGQERIYVGQGCRFIRRVEFLSEEGKLVSTIAFDNIKFNSGIGDEAFRYAPPAGVTAIDITDMVKQHKAAAAEAKKTAASGEEAGASWTLVPGTPAPALSARDFDGAPVEVRAMRGKPLLVFFWASWQKDSVARLAEADKLAKERKDFAILAVSLDDPGVVAAVKKALAANGIAATPALGTSLDLKAWRIVRLPSWVLVDSAGKVVAGEREPAGVAPLKAALEKAAAK